MVAKRNTATYANVHVCVLVCFYFPASGNWYFEDEESLQSHPTEKGLFILLFPLPKSSAPSWEIFINSNDNVCHSKCSTKKNSGFRGQ